MDEVITVQFDGGSRGNPGPAGVGIVLRAADGTPLVTLGRFIGRATNNVAEYKALITGLQEALKLGAKKIIVRGDSQLVVKQMLGQYRVKHPDLRPLYEEAQELIHQFEKHKIEHNFREDNTLADKLANLAMDKKRDVTDVMESDIAARPAPRAAPMPSRSPQPPEASEKVLVGTTHFCPRCGCEIEVRKDSTSKEQAPFTCVCGVRMKAE
jgi:ribonuclease HI